MAQFYTIVFSSHQVILYLLKIKLFHGIPPTPNQQTDSATSRIYLVQFLIAVFLVDGFETTNQTGRSRWKVLSQITFGTSRQPRKIQTVAVAIRALQGMAAINDMFHTWKVWNGSMGPTDVQGC